MEAITIAVENVRSIGSAQFDLAPGITLIAGLNEQGKSTVAQVIGALLYGSATALTGTQTRDAEAWIRKGAKEAVASMVVGDSSRTLGWKGDKAVMKESGDPQALPRVHRLVAGLTRWSDLQPKERADLAADTWNGRPTLDDLKAAFKEAKIAVVPVDPDPDGNPTRWEPPQGHIILSASTWATVATAVSAGEWDQALQVAKDCYSGAARGWTETAGEKYGVQKAETWRPEGWTDDLLEFPFEDEPTLQNVADGGDEGTLADAWDKARKIRSAVETRKAVETDDFLKSEKLGATYETLLEQQKRHVNDLVRLKTEYDEAIKVTIHLRSNAAQLVCPHCDKAVMNSAGKLTKADKIERPTPEAVAAAQATEESARKAVQEQERLLNAHTAHTAMAKSARDTTRATRDALAQAAGGDVEVDIETATQVEEKAKARFLAHYYFHTAAQYHKAAIQWAAVGKVLAPDGVRAAKLNGVRTRIEKAMSTVTKGVLGKAVTLNDAWSFVLDGVPWATCSGAQRWVLDAAAAVAVAEAQEAPVVVLDTPNSGADILMANLRGKLFAEVLPESTIDYVLVTCSFKDRETCPDFDALGLGDTLWIADGSVTRLGEGA